MPPSALPIQLSPAVEPKAGTCRVCGCTALDGCILKSRLVRVDGGWATEILDTCSWVEQDLCSRCHGPRNPTRRQASEITRIRSRKGEVRVSRGRGLHQLEVALVAGADALGPHYLVRPAVLTLSASGRVVHRLERDVVARRVL